MKTQIFIVSHVRDFAYLKWCLASIQKFCTGFSGVTVLLPEIEISQFIPFIGPQFGKVQLSVVGFNQVPAPRGHLHHCVQKCKADTYCYGVDLIFYVDSDCIFREPVTPEDYLVDGKPVMLVDSYEEMRKQNDPAVCWQSGTAEVLGFVPTHECMRRHPEVHYAKMLPEFRKFVEETHLKPFEEYALSCKPEFPVGFNDFNNLGAFAHKFWTDRYHIIDLSVTPDQRPRDHLIQYWSYGPINKSQEGWLDGKIRQVVPIEDIKRVLNV